MTKTKDGYILIFVGKKHNLATVSGQAFEHRLVYQKFLGRPLLKTEIIHHINGKKDDNRIENLRLCRSIAEHRSLHRKKFPMILCRCGCGNKFNGRDKKYRKRVYIKGHAPASLFYMGGYFHPATGEKVSRQVWCYHKKKGRYAGIYL